MKYAEAARDGEERGRDQATRRGLGHGQGFPCAPRERGGHGFGREESFSGIVLGTSLGSEQPIARRARKEYQIGGRFVRSTFAHDESGRRRQAHGPEPGAVRRGVPPHPEGHPRPDGREKVRALVEEILKDDAFVARHVGDDVPERKILYEDPEPASASSPRVSRRQGERAARSRPDLGDLRPGRRARR